MKLSECNMGQIVVAKGEGRKIGHIIGLIYNNSIREYWNDPSTEIIPLVKFVDDQVPRGIHYNNIAIFKAY